MQNENTDHRKLSITKVLSASIDKVWQAWTDPAQLIHWWAPEGFTTTVHKMDVRQGEEWLLTLHGPDGKNYPNRSIFLEVVAQKKISFEHFNPDFITTVTFERRENKTEMEWTMVFPTKELFDVVVKTFKADEGLKQNVEKLEGYLGQ